MDDFFPSFSSDSSMNLNMTLQNDCLLKSSLVAALVTSLCFYNHELLSVGILVAGTN